MLVGLTSSAHPPRGWGRRCRSAQEAVDFGQEAGEGDLVVARLPGGGEVGALPVASLVGERGVFLAGDPADAVVFVVSVEPGEVAETGLGAAGEGASAVAAGAHGRVGGEDGVAKLV